MRTDNLSLKLPVLTKTCPWHSLMWVILALWTWTLCQAGLGIACKGAYVGLLWLGYWREFRLHGSRCHRRAVVQLSRAEGSWQLQLRSGKRLPARLDRNHCYFSQQFLILFCRCGARSIFLWLPHTANNSNDFKQLSSLLQCDQ